jgi:hypothetical protein
LDATLLGQAAFLSD